MVDGIRSANLQDHADQFSEKAHGNLIHGLLSIPSATEAEKWLWRNSALFPLSLPVFVVVCIVVYKYIPSMSLADIDNDCLADLLCIPAPCMCLCVWSSIVCSIITIPVMITLGRIYFLVGSIIGLWKTAPGTDDTVEWTNFLLYGLRISRTFGQQIDFMNRQTTIDEAS